MTLTRCVTTLEEKFERTPSMIQAAHGGLAQGVHYFISFMDYCIVAPLKEVLEGSTDVLKQITGESDAEVVQLVEEPVQTPITHIPEVIQQPGETVPEAVKPKRRRKKVRSLLDPVGEPGATTTITNSRRNSSRVSGGGSWCDAPVYKPDAPKRESVEVSEDSVAVLAARKLLAGAQKRVKEQNSESSSQREGISNTRPKPVLIENDEEDDTYDTDTENEEDPDVYARAKRILNDYTRDQKKRTDYFVQFCRLLSRRKFRRTMVTLGERRDFDSIAQARKEIRPIFRHLEPKTDDVDGTLKAIMECFVEKVEFRTLIVSSINAKMSAE